MSIDVIGTQIDHTEQAPVVLGSEKIPTGGRGLYHVTVDQVRDYVLTYFGKESIRLGEVDNTSDEDKPLSRATREALSKKLNKSDQFVRSINGLTGDIDLVPTVLGLGNVDNTADKDKPLSEVAIRALSTKLDKVTFKDFKRVFHIFEQQVYDKFTKLDEIDTQLLNRVSQLEEADIEITKTLQDLTKYLNRELARISSTLSEEQMKIVSNYLGANFDNLLKTSSWLPLRLNKLHQDILVSINVVRAITDNLAVNDTNLKNQLDSLIVQLNSRISKINEDLSNINSKVSSNENVINRQFVEAREYFDQQINGLLPLIQGAADKYLRDLSDFQQTVDDVTRTLHNSVANVQTQIDVQSVVTESLNQALNSKHEILLDMMASQGKTLEDLIDSATQSARNDMRDLGYRMQELDYNYERKYQSMEGVLETQVESTKQLVKKQVAQVNSDIEAVKNLATTLEDQAQALADKYENRLTEVTEATLLDITEILQDSLQQETLERNQAIIDAVLKESHDRIDAIKLEATTRNNLIESKVSEINTSIVTQINSVQDGINQEVINRTDDIATVRGEINSYKSSNDTAVSTALQKIETITTDYNSTVTALDALHSTFSDLSTDLSEVTSDLSTFKQTVADADNALASSVNTLATTLQNNNTEVNGRITGVETSVTTLEENINIKTSQLQSSLDTTNAAIGVAQNAVNGALEVIATKADANTVDTLESKVTSIDGKVTSQGSSITELTNDLTITKEKVDTKADSSALSSLTNEVTTLDGKILAQSNAITNLQSQTTNIENSLETKVEATALSDYYTKAETDTVSAGKLEEFKAGLKLGGTNLIPNSNLFSVGATSDQNLLREILPNGNLKITNKGVTLQTYLAHFYDASTTFDELLKLQDGDDFTTSVWVKAVNVDSLPTVLPLLYFSDLLSYEEMQGDLTQLSSGKEVVYTQTRKFVKDVTNISPHFQLSHHSVGGGIIITKWQIEKGTLASDWSPSNQEVRDILNANTVAINITNTETSRINELVTTQGSSISSLEGNLQLVDAKLGVAITNAATAQSTANTAINNVESTADSLNKLSSKFEVSALAANNLLINSNESKEYDGTYPHHVYMLTEPWEVDATYTLLWCAEHRQNDNEPYSFLSVYAGGGLQDVQMLRQTDGKVVSKTTFIKTNSGLSPEIHFYLLNQPSVSEGTVATVYWAVLVKGDTITTDRWIPSSKEYIPQLSVTNANITTLSRTLTDADTALSRRIDTLSSTVSNNDTTVSGKINDVVSSVSTLDANTTTKFSTLESSISTIESNVAKKFDASAINDYYTKTKADEAIAGKLETFNANLQIGGTNLFSLKELLSYSGGELSNVTSYITVAGSTLSMVDQGYNLRLPGNLIPIDHTKDIIVSWYPVGSYSGHYIYYVTQDASGAPIIWQRYKTGDKGADGRVVITIPKSELSSSVTHLRLGLGSVENTTYSIRDVQVEQGTKVTAWSPNPKDFQNAIDANASAINTTNTEVFRVNGLVTTQSTAINKLQSDLTTLDTKTGQAITNAATAQQTANTAVTNDKATSDRVDALTTTVANNNTTVTGKINDVVTSVTTLEGNTNSKISSLESSLSIISSVITISSAIDILKDLTITDASPGEITKVTDLTATGGQVLSVGNNTSNDCVWARSTQALTIDPNRMYRLRARLRLIAGTGYIYLGVGCLTADKSSYVNAYNSVGSSLGSSNYLLESARPPTDTWVTYEYFLQGKSTGPVIGSGTIQDPRTFAPLAAFASPMFIVNYPSTSGTVEIDYITLEIADDLKETRGTSTALASLTTQVNTVDGNVVTLSNDLTTLKGTTTALENNVAKKLDASVINNYFTKTEADTATAGHISSYDANLVIGGTNLFSIADSVAGYTAYGTGSIIQSTPSHLAMQSLIPIGTHKQLVYQVWNPSLIINTVNTNRLVFFKADGSFLSLYDVPQLDGTPYQKSLITVPDTAAYVRLAAIVGQYNEVRDPNLKVKFEFGNKPTDWTPSDGDVQSSLNANANAIQTVNAEVLRINGEVVSTANSVNNLTSSVGLLQGSINEVRQTVTNNQESTNTYVISLKSGMADADDVSMMMRNATVVYEDLSFKNGWNGVQVYNNYGNGVLAANFTDKLADNPVASTRQLQFIHSGGDTTPGLGGFYQQTQSRANGVFLIKFVAKLPVGFSFGLEANSFGDNSSHYFIGDSEGTGKFKTYYGVFRCGTTGSFSTVGFVYVNGPYPTPENPLIWYLASSTMYDCLDSKVVPDSVVNGIAEAKSTANTAVNKSEATALIAQNLQASLDNTNANISNNYYTKSSTDEAISNQITNLSATLDMSVLPSKRDTTKANQWLLTHVVPKDAGWVSQGVKPDFSMLKTGIKNKRIYCADGNTSFSGSEYDNTVLYFRTIVYVHTDVEVNLGNFIGDDAHSIYVNGVLNFNKGYYGFTDNLRLALKTGLNTVDVICYNGVGGAGFFSSVLLSSLVVNMYAPESVEEQAAATANAVSSLTTTVSNIDGMVSSQARQMVTLESSKSAIENGGIAGNDEYIVDLRDPAYNRDLYYPVLLSGFSTEYRQTIRVMSTLNGASVPPWSSHAGGFSLNAQFQMGGAGWGTIDPEVVTDNFSFSFTHGGISPLDQIGQIGSSSQPFFYVRGGGYYRLSKPVSRSVQVCVPGGSFVGYHGESVYPRPYQESTVPKSINQGLNQQNVKLRQTNEVIDGVKAISTVTVDNNGILSGYGLVSQLINGQVTSAFGINADQFYIGAPSSGKKPFTVLTSPGTVNGIPVPAGTYIDTAYIADATITSAKIQELNGAKITAGSIKAEQLSVQSLSALNAKIGTITTTGSQGSMTISDSLIEIRDSSGKIRVRLGIW